VRAHLVLPEAWIDHLERRTLARVPVVIDIEKSERPLLHPYKKALTVRFHVGRLANRKKVPTEWRKEQAEERHSVLNN
jgi:hypothetical protein